VSKKKDRFSINVNGVVYTDPIEAMSAVWSGVLEVESGLASWIRDLQDEFDDIRHQIDDLDDSLDDIAMEVYNMKKKRWWKR
jgi:hypothetical protein